MKRKKRTTFLKLMTKSGIVALGLTLFFSFVLHEVLLLNVRMNADSTTQEIQSTIAQGIGTKANTYENPSKQIDHCMKIYSNFNTLFFGRYIAYDNDNHTLSVLFDKDGNIVSSSKRKFITYVKEEGKLDGYICDNETIKNPQVDELYRVYNELESKEKFTSDSQIYVTVSIESAYIDRENYVFIPHKCRMELRQDVHSVEDNEVLEAREFNIDIDDSNYELITNHSGTKEYPHIFISVFSGTDEDFYDSYVQTLKPNPHTIAEHYQGEKDTYVTSRSTEIWIKGEKYELYTVSVINEKAPYFKKLCMQLYIMILFGMMFLAFLWSLFNNIKNKAQYKFEDYQKTLINNLAHDLKTPLTAIGGYAENALKSGDSSEIQVYLSAISENVLYTDRIINRTLELNHFNEVKTKKENINLIEIAEKSIEKYSLMLEEKNIAVEVNGRFSLMADKNSLETAVENLISNAVKYTTENGKIKITANKNSLTITNDTGRNIDTKNLIMPFVKDDKSRSEKSSGLGLAIVKNFADANRLKLKISSKENQFTAVLKK